MAASFLGPVVLATQSVLLVSASTTFQAPYALSIAAAVRIGNLLGESKAKRAAITAHASFFIVVLISIGWRYEFSPPVTAARVQLTPAYSAMFLVFRDHWGKLFNDDPGMVPSLFTRA